MLIENNFLRVNSKEEGAELTSIYNKQHGLEYLWQAGAAWPKHAPVLFPIVGQLKDNTFFYEGKPYHLDRHGFARTAEFVLHQHTATEVVYRLQSTAHTLRVYPFQFVFDIKYEVKENSLIITYSVQNTDEKEILFSIGAHPAFKIPLRDEDAYNDYYLEFDKPETADRWMIDNGLIKDTSTPFFKDTKTLSLQKQLFYEDALVFKNLASSTITIKNNNHAHGLQFTFEGFPYFGIWAAKDADFVCLEPWLGIADSVGTNQQLQNKEGILRLGVNKIFECVYSVTCF